MCEQKGCYLVTRKHTNLLKVVHYLLLGDALGLVLVDALGFVLVNAVGFVLVEMLVVYNPPVTN